MKSRKHAVSLWMLVALSLIATAPGAAVAQDEDVELRPGIYARRSTVPNDWGAEVLLNGQVVMRVRQGLGPMTALRRAEAMADRLEELQEHRLLDHRTLRVTTRGGAATLFAGPHPIATASQQDGRSFGANAFLLANGWKSALTMALGG